MLTRLVELLLPLVHGPARVQGPKQGVYRSRQDGIGHRRAHEEICSHLGRARNRCTVRPYHLYDLVRSGDSVSTSNGRHRACNRISESAG